MHPRNTIMISSYQPHDVVPDHLILIVVDIIDTRDVQPDACKQAPPASHGVRTDNGMNWRKFIVLVERRATWRHDLVSAGFASRFEDGLRASGRECFHVGAEGWGHPVVALEVSIDEPWLSHVWGTEDTQFVTRTPKSISTRWRRVLHTQKTEV